MDRGRLTKLRDRSGQSVAELVLISPVLLFIAFGLIEFGGAFWTHQLITNVAREGARVSTLTDTSEERVLEVVDERLRSSGLDPEQAEVVLSCDGQDDGLCSGPDRGGRSSRVSVAYSYRFIVLGGLSRLTGGDGSAFGEVKIAARTTMVNE